MQQMSKFLVRCQQNVDVYGPLDIWVKAVRETALIWVIDIQERFRRWETEAGAFDIYGFNLKIKSQLGARNVHKWQWELS